MTPHSFAQQIRNSKIEIRNKLESRNPKFETMLIFSLVLDFLVRILELFRDSDFEFRVFVQSQRATSEWVFGLTGIG